MSFFGFGPAHELFGWNDAVFEFDKIHTLYVYAKTINQFMTTDDVISAIRECLGAQNVVFQFWAGARTFCVE